MIYRRLNIDDELDELLPLNSAIALDGPKAVGKTSTGLARAHQTRLLDDPSPIATI